MSKASVPFFILLFFLSACASSRINPLLGQNLDAPLEESVFKALTKNSNEFWQGRDKKENLLAFLESNEQIARSQNSSQTVLVLWQEPITYWENTLLKVRTGK
jgi:hypothetical protein